jgi:hypothetical protein
MGYLRLVTISMSYVGLNKGYVRLPRNYVGYLRTTIDYVGYVRPT